jgi:hypothetical protein
MRSTIASVGSLCDKSFRRLFLPGLLVDGFDRKLDWAVDEPFVKHKPPPVLYHYTGLQGFEAILRDRSFRATAHSHTNDPDELRAVDDLAVPLASRLGRTLKSAAARQVMIAFAEWFPSRPLSALTTVYLSCFSSARDEAVHWKKYGRVGSGVCFGLQILGSEVLPEDHNLGRAILRVNYDRSSWETQIDRGFRNVADVCQHFLDSGALRADWQRARELAVTALARVVGLADIGAKTRTWQDEQEWRYATMIRKGADVIPGSYDRDDGVKVPCLLPLMRAPGRLLVLDEVVVGPNADFSTAEAAVREILTKTGYGSEGAPMPRISRSQCPPL